VLEYVLMARSC